MPKNPGIKGQTSGLKTEMTGITMDEAVKELETIFHKSAKSRGSNELAIIDVEENEWTIYHSPTVCPERMVGEVYVSTSNFEYKVGFSASGLSYASLPALQEAVCRLYCAGAKVNNSCSCVVYVDAYPHSRRSLVNLMIMLTDQEFVLRQALGGYSRLTELAQRPARGTEADFVRPKEQNPVALFALNLHEAAARGTVAFPIFRSTLHPDELTAQINLCLAMSAHAIRIGERITGQARPANGQPFQEWLTQLGLSGDEFKKTRAQLLKRLREPEKERAR